MQSIGVSTGELRSQEYLGNQRFPNLPVADTPQQSCEEFIRLNPAHQWTGFFNFKLILKWYNII